MMDNDDDDNDHRIACKTKNEIVIILQSIILSLPNTILCGSLSCMRRRRARSFSRPSFPRVKYFISLRSGELRFTNISVHPPKTEVMSSRKKNILYTDFHTQIEYL